MTSWKDRVSARMNKGTQSSATAQTIDNSALVEKENTAMNNNNNTTVVNNLVIKSLIVAAKYQTVKVDLEFKNSDLEESKGKPWMASARSSMAPTEHRIKLDTKTAFDLEISAMLGAGEALSTARGDCSYLFPYSSTGEFIGDVIHMSPYARKDGRVGAISKDAWQLDMPEIAEDGSMRLYADILRLAVPVEGKYIMADLPLPIAPALQWFELRSTMNTLATVSLIGDEDRKIDFTTVTDLRGAGAWGTITRQCTHIYLSNFAMGKSYYAFVADRVREDGTVTSIVSRKAAQAERREGMTDDAVVEEKRAVVQYGKNKKVMAYNHARKLAAGEVGNLDAATGKSTLSIILDGTQVNCSDVPAGKYQLFNLKKGTYYQSTGFSNNTPVSVIEALASTYELRTK